MVLKSATIRFSFNTSMWPWCWLLCSPSVSTAGPLSFLFTVLVGDHEKQKYYSSIHGKAQFHDLNSLPLLHLPLTFSIASKYWVQQTIFKFQLTVLSLNSVSCYIQLRWVFMHCYDHAHSFSSILIFILSHWVSPTFLWQAITSYIVIFHSEILSYLSHNWIMTPYFSHKMFHYTHTVVEQLFSAN